MPSTFRRAVSAAAALAVPTVALLGTVTFSTPASAATSTACSSGGFTATLPNGTVVRPGSTGKISSSGLTADSRVKLRGRYVEFDFAPVTGNIYDYVYTGAANPLSMTPGVRTPVWASKTLDLGTAFRGDLEVRADGTDLLMLSRGSAGKVKIQAKDCATGGVFQQEVETSRAVTATHTLAAGMYFYTNPYTGKINLGNGTDFRGKDSPQVATRKALNETVSVWEIAPGGRMGYVTGEDAVELSNGASACVQDCQAQNRLRGSVDVTDPAYSG